MIHSIPDTYSHLYLSSLSHQSIYLLYVCATGPVVKRAGRLGGEREREGEREVEAVCSVLKEPLLSLIHNSTRTVPTETSSRALFVPVDLGQAQ